jgi:hypothetical protein
MFDSNGMLRFGVFETARAVFHDSITIIHLLWDLSVINTLVPERRY